jgi:hypothetical protein
MSVDSLVDSLRTYRRRPLWARGFVGPFLLLYSAWFYLWLGVYGVDEYWEIGCIFTVAILLFQAGHCSLSFQSLSFRSCCSCSVIGSFRSTVS